MRKKLLYGESAGEAGFTFVAILIREVKTPASAVCIGHADGATAGPGESV